MAATTPSAPRRPYKGSCHCGKTQYIAFMTLPPPVIEPCPPASVSTMRIRKCNCSACHKMSFFHVKLMDAPNDFFLTKPLDPVRDLSDYKCSSKLCHWYFCPACGVRCFAFIGQGELKEVEVEGEKQQAWTPKTEGWNESRGCYLSVNASTLEPGQDGLDLKEWTEKGWIAYFDMLDNLKGLPRMGEPHRGGSY